MSILKFENDATPATAATGVVPESVPLLGLVPIAIAIEFVAVVTVFPSESWTVTCTAGAIDEPAPTFVGCTVNASLFATPAVTLNALLVADVSPVALAESV